MKRIAIILGGGEGKRAGGGLPKQFQPLCGRPVIWWAMRAFRQAFPDIRLIIIIHPEYLLDWEEMTSSWPEAMQINHEFYCGGRDRCHSVLNALMAVDEPDALVAVHDGARPCVSPRMIADGFRAAGQKGAVVPAVPLTDSLRRLGAHGASVAVPRGGYRAVQTPQIFPADILKKAYSAVLLPEFTDDASVVEADGGVVTLYKGSADNIKITYPRDFITAEFILRSRGDA